MKKIIALSLFLFTTGCNSIDMSTVIPSFWDDNQSRSIVTVYQLASNINCDELPTNLQVKRIVDELQWFQLYSESKGMLQKDVLNLVQPMQKTVIEWAAKDKSSNSYCKIKKQIVTEQAKMASKAVLGRF